jgi:fibronectin-binding autotransporter adhesin
MRTRGFFGPAFASAIIAPFTAYSATDTWDGGGFNDILTTPQNWADNTAPASDIFDTDLIFAGPFRPTPIVSAPFSARAIAFSASATSFSVLGAQLNIGIAGITNSSINTMTFSAPVSFNDVPLSQISTSSTGGLNFVGTVTLPTIALSSALTLDGDAPLSFHNVLGNSSLIKNGSGTMTWTPTVAVACDVEVNEGTLTMDADEGPIFFGPTASIVLNGSSVFNINEDLTLSGAQLTRTSSTDINLATGKTLRLQSGADAIFEGVFGTSTAASIVVTGAGSTFSITNSFAVNHGGTFSLLSGASFSGENFFNVGLAGGTSSATVDGNNSSLTADGIALGQSGNSGTLTFSNSSTGSLGFINLAVFGGAGTTGMLNIQSGAQVAGQTLDIAPAQGQTGTITITGDDSELSLAAGGTATIGAASGSTDTLNVQNGGRFNSGTGLTTVNPTGSISLIDGDYYSYGDLTINGGQVTRDANSSLVLQPGTTMTVQAGGDVAVTANFNHNTGAAITITGAGSTFSLNGTFFILADSTLEVLAGGALINTASGGLTVGSITGHATMTVSGTGSTVDFSNGPLTVGPSGVTASLTFSNSSTGTFAAIIVDSSNSSATDGFLRIQNGATVTGTSLVIAPNTAANTGDVTITGVNSELTISGAGTVNIGAASGSTGTLNLESNGTFHSGTGLTTVNPTGSIAIGGGLSTYNSNGDLTLNGGQLTRAQNGIFNLAAGRTFTVQAGGDAVFTSAFTNATTSTIVVIGAGSTLSTTGALGIQGGSILSIAAGGSVTSGPAQINIGTTGGNGTVTVDGIGSSLAGGGLVLAQAGNMANLTFSNGSTGSFGNIGIDASAVVETNAALNIQSGASVTGTSLIIAPNAAANIGSATVSGTGSALTINGAVNLGAANASIATLTVQNGGVFNGTTGTLLNTTGTINITGGTVNLNGPLVRNGGILNFASGALNIVDTFTVGPSGLLGQNVVLDTTRQLTTTGNATIEASAALTFHGGVFSANSLNSNGDLNFSNGATTIRGDVSLNPGSHVTLSGAGTVTMFADDVVHNTTEILVEAGACAVFAEVQSGSGSFTGPGLVRFEGDHHPGAPRAAISFGGDVFYGPSATLQLELAGIAQGSDYDAINVSGDLTLGGTMNIVLAGGFQPSPGALFDLLDWGTIIGKVETVTLPPLGGGLSWDTSQLFVNGTLAVVPEPSSALLLIAGLAPWLIGRRRTRRSLD